MAKERKPIRRVSKKRAAQLRDYSKLRKIFLEEHPWCQWWLAEHGFEEKDVKVGPDGIGWVVGPAPLRNQVQVPHSVEIHHRNKRFGSRLNDKDYWLAVSREGHLWIENNKGKAREKGYLLGF